MNKWPEFVNARQIAAILKISVKHARALQRSGEIETDCYGLSPLRAVYQYIDDGTESVYGAAPPRFDDDDELVKPTQAAIVVRRAVKTLHAMGRRCECLRVAVGLGELRASHKRKAPPRETYRMRRSDIIRLHVRLYGVPPPPEAWAKAGIKPPPDPDDPEDS